MNKRQRKKARKKLLPNVLKFREWYIGPEEPPTGDPFVDELNTKTRAVLADIFDGFVGL